MAELIACAQLRSQEQGEWEPHENSLHKFVSNLQPDEQADPADLRHQLGQAKEGEDSPLVARKAEVD